MTDKQVARELGLSPRTVEMHVALALRALSCANRAEAVFRASQEGLLIDVQ
jgi:DNA-binding NarL/FixJ family response regulator